MKSIISRALFIFVVLVVNGCSDKEASMIEETPLRNYKLAMAQMEVEPGKPEANLNRAIERISAAAANGAKIILLPEVMDLGWTDPSAKSMAYEIPNGKTCLRLRDAASRNKIYVCAGIVEKYKDKTYNAAVIINPSGEVILTHRKLNELEIAHDLYAQGDKLNVAHTPLGTLGLYICADATAQGNVLSSALGYMGADIILSPSAWAVPPDFDNNVTPYGDTWRNVYQSVSKNFDLWIVGVSNVGKIEAGPWKDWNCIGSSLIFAPGGNELLQAPYGVNADTIIYVDIALKDRPARGTTWTEYWNREK
ncbi:carbon-nitrogen hydrolase family protein [Chryseolinea sp. H1M3-3]|uniref:carbon-nitrogen hydrolase family protein n=1 Tax=Chryseolinea sp. H1M3-3 TaxID=3034144 RepID=UPI0023ED67DA|nr:carbon-nitrogen hydrolase family protein [Chryseolinea sp. H1M3-3]